MSLSVTKRLSLGFFTLVAFTVICQLLASFFISQMEKDFYEITEINARLQIKAAETLDVNQEIRILYRQIVLDPPATRTRTQTAYNTAKTDLLRQIKELEPFF